MCMVSKYIHQLLNKYCNSIIFINPSYKKRLIDDPLLSLQRRTAEITVDSGEQNAVFVRISGEWKHVLRWIFNGQLIHIFKLFFLDSYSNNKFKNKIGLLFKCYETSVYLFIDILNAY